MRKFWILATVSRVRDCVTDYFLCVVMQNFISLTFMVYFLFPLVCKSIGLNGCISEISERHKYGNFVYELNLLIILYSSLCTWSWSILFNQLIGLTQTIYRILALVDAVRISNMLLRFGDCNKIDRYSAKTIIKKTLFLYDSCFCHQIECPSL